jgi:hypothetical protein
MEEALKPDKISAAIVAANYLCSPSEVRKIILDKKIEENYFLEFVEPKFTNSDNVNLPKEVLENIKKQIPIINYKDNNNKLFLSFLCPEAKVTIEDKTFNSNDFDAFKKLSQDIVYEKISSLIAVGINFIIEKELPYKLHLFNDEISGISRWTDNQGFNIAIPIKQSNEIVVTYSVSKINEKPNENAEDGKTRVYKIEANFNYNLTSISNVKQKVELLSQFLEDDLMEYYKMFIANYEKFLNIGINNDNKNK